MWGWRDMKKLKAFFSKIGVWLKNHKPSKRRLIQLYTALLYNANLKGYFDGQLFNGATKKMCLPGFNCYSCPGAIAACPLGSLQSALTNSDHKWTAYVFGILAIFGLMLGRTICGFFCPVGLCQELLYKLPTPKVKKSVFTRIFSYFKYVILAVMVVFLPLAYMEGSPVPSFCKYICPAGLFEGAFGLLPNNPTFYGMLGVVFSWKFLLLLAFIVLSVVFFRFFCRFICPLGALYGFFSRVALLGVKVDKKKCTDCGLCIAVCKMDTKRVGDHECIHCGECISVCPTKAISWKGSALFVRTNDLESPTPEGKPLTAFLQPSDGANAAETAVTETTAVTDAAETVPVEVVDSETAVAETQSAPMMLVDRANPKTMPSAIAARAKEKKRNKILEAVAWALAGVVLIGAIVYANVFVKAKPAMPSVQGEICKEFTLETYGGEDYVLSENSGKATVLLFWQADKKECEDLMPTYNEVAVRLKKSANLLAVHTEETYGKDVGKWIEKWQDYEIVFAQDSMQETIGSNLYDGLGGEGAYPMLAVLDGAGRIRHTATSGFATAAELEQMIATNLQGAEVGCYFGKDITLTEVNSGAQYALNNLSKPTVINFWFTTCAPCCEEMPEINAFHEEYAGAIDTVAVHQKGESIDVIRQFLAGYKDIHNELWKDYSIGFALDQVHGENNETLYYYLGGKTAWPMTVVLNESGYVIYRIDGKMEHDDFTQLRSILDAELAK